MSDKTMSDLEKFITEHCDENIFGELVFSAEADDLRKWMDGYVRVPVELLAELKEPQ